MIIASTIKHLLQNNSGYIGLDPDTVFAYNIPDDVNPNSVKSVVIRITEISDTPSTYGSNRSIDSLASAEVQMFFPRTFRGDTSLVRARARNVLEHDGWYCKDDGGMKRDPDSFLMMNSAMYDKKHQ